VPCATASPRSSPTAPSCTAKASATTTSKWAFSVGIQKMVRSDVGSSGVAFSLDTESGFKDVVLINGSYGLGEMVVQGAVSPDEFLVFKPTLAEGFSSIIEKKLGNKDRKMVYGVEPGKPTSPSPSNARSATASASATIRRWRSRAVWRPSRSTTATRRAIGAPWTWSGPWTD
jgi:hypothetical protein